MNHKRNAWLNVLAVYVASVALALNQAKVPPLMQPLMADLEIDMATGAGLMSSLAVAGMILGLPAALILGRLGPRRAGLLALGCTLGGAVAGALAPSASVLLASRVLEGVGLGMISVVAPAVISLWFPPQERGTPMGLWATWVPVGSFTMFNLAGPLGRAFGWQGAWWFGAAAALLAFGLYAAVVSVPPLAAGQAPAGSVALPSRSVLLNGRSWLLAIIFATFNFGAMGYGTWAPSYLNQSIGLSPERANFGASLVLLTYIPATAFAGWVLDRTRRRHLVLTAALVISGLLIVWSFQLPGAQAVAPFMIATGVVGSFIPAATFTLAPESMPRPELAGWALGMVSVGQNVGLFLGPPMVAAFIGDGTWAAGGVPLGISALVGVGASLFLLRYDGPAGR